MIAMQYIISLPDDYNMRIIRTRAEQNGYKTDGFRGLAFKAYLISEKGKFGNEANRYAPFYLWNEHEGMNRFLFGGPYDAILDSFGWQQVNIGVPLSVRTGEDFPRARWTVEVSGSIPRERSLAGFGARLSAQLPDAGNAAGEALVYNPDKWGFRRFAFYETLPEGWGDKAERDRRLDGNGYGVTVYEVLHLSR
ncbi:DUF4865 family protein [Saccharibacillus alkalitolerans]|uniref:DUF4865 family protein n=1 Tax=Saccharibacillus alkalitolerans TaxID=2705290 RepID=A0ABX0F166_9BACL|nr:DUF4865 family protein [Saccharibacillus alkalitolerans]NGZ74723.1 DUF4865 family protein [Saccharibacillus alkalitolerans]